jgi:hypothetical protein
MSINKKIKKFVQKYPALVRMKREIWHQFFDYSRLNLCESFPILSPNSAGDYKDIANLTINTIKNTFPAMCDLAISLDLKKNIIEEIAHVYTADTESLKNLIEFYKSDKADHGYLNFYATVLQPPSEIKKVFEIGLGTNNTDVVSNMGHFGKPGASLRAFRDYLPNADIYGADIDKRILFEEDRIKTFFVDQTSQDELNTLANLIPNDFDLIIDDGLHSPDANIRTLNFALKKIKVGGWIAIEDIRFESLPVWDIVSLLLPKNFESHIIKANQYYIFGVRRLS